MNDRLTDEQVALFAYPFYADEFLTESELRLAHLAREVLERRAAGTRTPSFTDDEWAALNRHVFNEWMQHFSDGPDCCDLCVAHVALVRHNSPSPALCNCGFGGFHDDANPRCNRNKE